MTLTNNSGLKNKPECGHHNHQQRQHNLEAEQHWLWLEVLVRWGGIPAIHNPLAQTKYNDEAGESDSSDSVQEAVGDAMVNPDVAEGDVGWTEHHGGGSLQYIFT